MNDIRTLHLEILQQQLGKIACEIVKIGFHAQREQPPWRPRINVYRCRDHILICAELAGIDRSDIDLRVEPFRVSLIGRRRPPAPTEDHGELRQIFAWEIDDGPCEREILLPEEIVPEEAHAQQRNGLLWIELPLRLKQ